MRKQMTRIALVAFILSAFVASAAFAAVWPNTACFTSPPGSPGRLANCKTTNDPCVTGGPAPTCKVGGKQVLTLSWDNYVELTYKYCGGTVYASCDDNVTPSYCRSRDAHLDFFCTDFACTVWMPHTDCANVW